MAKTMVKDDTAAEDPLATKVSAAKMSQVVRAYLDVLASRASDGIVEERRLNLERIEARIAAETNPLARLRLLQDRVECRMEQDFIGVVKDYASSKGISYYVWREVGVSAAVLREAGVTEPGKRATDATLATANGHSNDSANGSTSESNGSTPNGEAKLSTKEQRLLMKAARLWVVHGNARQVGADLGVHKSTADRLRIKAIENGMLAPVAGRKRGAYQLVRTG